MASYILEVLFRSAVWKHVFINIITRLDLLLVFILVDSELMYMSGSIVIKN